MGKELDALERLKTAPSFMGGTAEYQFCTKSETLLMQDYETVKQALLKAQEPKQYVDELKLVEKKLQALEIIKKKEVNMQVFNQCEDVETYNKVYIKQKDRQLTEEEFNLLKEVLE